MSSKMAQDDNDYGGGDDIWVDLDDDDNDRARPPSFRFLHMYDSTDAHGGYFKFNDERRLRCRPSKQIRFNNVFRTQNVRQRSQASSHLSSALP